MKKILSVAIAMMLSPLLFSQVNIIPKPVSMKVGAGTFTISPATRIVFSEKDAKLSVAFLNDYLQKFYGFILTTDGKETSGNNVIVLTNDKKKNRIEGAYKLNVIGNWVAFNGADPQGIFYGVQTLIQLLPTEPSQSLAIDQVSIDDAPRFAYRGMMLDVGRHFFDVDFVKKYIDFLALHKMNRFHWHLTEDQGWRSRRFRRFTPSTFSG